MKYTRLSLQDLKDLEKEFVEFLALNGIPADEWERLKKEDMDKVEQVIDHFSDVIWEGVLRKTEMVEHRRADKLTLCKIVDGELITLLMKTTDVNIDLTKTENIYKAISNIQGYQVSIQKDKIEKEATQQYFELLEIGFYIAKEPKYEALFEQVGNLS